MATFKSQLQDLKIGEVITKSKLFQDVSLKDLTVLKNRHNCNISGSINDAGLNGKVEIRADYTIMKSGVVIFTHVLRIK